MGEAAYTGKQCWSFFKKELIAMRPGAIIGILGLFLVVVTVMAVFALFANKKHNSGDDNSGAAAGATDDSVQSTQQQVQASVNIDFDDDADKILLSAADGEIIGPMELVEDSGASTGFCAMTPHVEEDEHRGGGVNFVVDVDTPGVYNLWLRVYWSHSCANSLWVEINGERVGEVTNNSFEHWQWIRLNNPVNLESGKNALTIISREDESKFDQALLTQDQSFVPVGVQSVD